MAKPNYSFEKRQRELAKKKKKEEKAKDKAVRKVGDAPGSDSAVDEGGSADETAAVTPATGSSPTP